jgi:hypothetical protein
VGYEFVLLFVGSFLTVVVGNYLAQSYARKSAELDAANKIFSEYSNLAGDRHFTMRQVSLALDGGADSDEVETRWAAYRRELQKWNTARGYNREMAKLYFGQPIWNVERDVHYLFRAWGETLEVAKGDPEKVDFKCLESISDELLEEIYRFNYFMGEAIQEDRIGSSKTRESVELNEAPDAPCQL